MGMPPDRSTTSCGRLRSRAGRRAASRLVTSRAMGKVLPQHHRRPPRLHRAPAPLLRGQRAARRRPREPVAQGDGLVPRARADDGRPTSTTVGSGNETAAHVLENGRITFMFCAFEGSPLILRLYGRGRTVLPGERRMGGAGAAVPDPSRRPADHRGRADSGCRPRAARPCRSTPTQASATSSSSGPPARAPTASRRTRREKNVAASTACPTPLTRDGAGMSTRPPSRPSAGAPPRRSHRLAARGGARRQRRHRLDGEPRHRHRRRPGRAATQMPRRRRRRSRRRRDVDGRRRVRLGQLAGRHRARRPGDRARASSPPIPTFEREELAAIYVARGLDPALARQVAEQLMAHDALGAHARDELGFSHVHRGAAGAGGARLGRLRSRVGAAMPLLHAARRARARRSPGHRRHVAALPRRPRRRRRAAPAGARVARRAARHLLGRAGDGVHGPRRLGLRRVDGVMAPALPKVRALTAGVDLETLGEWAPVETALGLLARARARLAREGFEVQLARLSLPPLLARLDPAAALDQPGARAPARRDGRRRRRRRQRRPARRRRRTTISRPGHRGSPISTRATVAHLTPASSSPRPRAASTGTTPTRRRGDARDRRDSSRWPRQLPLRRGGAGAGDDAVLPRRLHHGGADDLGRPRVGAPGPRRGARGAARRRTPAAG